MESCATYAWAPRPTYFPPPVVANAVGHAYANSAGSDVFWDPAAQEPPCGNFCYNCLKRPCSLGQHMRRGEFGGCLCKVCARPCPQQEDIVMGLMAFKEILADGAVENAAPPQVQGQAAAPSALGTQHEANGPSMFEVGLLNALLDPSGAPLRGGYCAVDDAADPVGPSVNVSVYASERTHRELVDANRCMCRHRTPEAMLHLTSPIPIPLEAH